jgi:hypothetical protein
MFAGDAMTKPPAPAPGAEKTFRLAVSSGS